MAKQINLITPVISKQELIVKVEHLVRNDGLTYVESLMQICSDLDIDPEDIGKMITGPLKDKIEAEAQRRNIIPKTSTSASLFK